MSSPKTSRVHLLVVINVVHCHLCIQCTYTCIQQTTFHTDKWGRGAGRSSTLSEAGFGMHQSIHTSGGGHVSLCRFCVCGWAWIWGSFSFGYSGTLLLRAERISFPATSHWSLLLVLMWLQGTWLGPRGHVWVVDTRLRLWKRARGMSHLCTLTHTFIKEKSSRVVKLNLINCV